MAALTSQMIIDAVRDETTGWQALMIDNWHRLFTTEKQILFAILQARAGGSSVNMTVNDGYITLDNGTDTVHVPTVTV